MHFFFQVLGAFPIGDTQIVYSRALIYEPNLNVYSPVNNGLFRITMLMFFTIQLLLY